jgi:hypothetical protein
MIVWRTVGKFPGKSGSMELRDNNGVGNMLATVYMTSNKRPFRAYVQDGKTQSYATVDKAVHFATKEVLMERN